MSQADSQPTVNIATRSLWRIRLAYELPRYLLYALSAMGLIASARFAIDPPRGIEPPAYPRSTPSPDLAAEGFAALFARRYLTWNARDPQAHQVALASFVGPGMDADAGLSLPSTGEQQVLWTQVVQERRPERAKRVYTVAVQTDTAGLLYLTVGVMRQKNGSLTIDGYPAFVGAPTSSVEESDDQTGVSLHEVQQQALTTVVDRALRNYMATSGSELAADLSPDARVSMPGLVLGLQSVQRLQWSAGPGAVAAVVQAQDRRGVRYTLDYEIDVRRSGGRWEVSAIQMDPNT
jgi:hypothetical protein